MEDKYRLVLLGDKGVGKTALVIQLALQKFDFEEEVRYHSFTPFLY
jgi:GTPase SAR1 family protein